jgi:hypothetical protein
MKSIKLTVILAFVLYLAGTTVAGATQILYVDTYNSVTGVSSLYTLTTAGVATKQGDIKLGGTGNLAITDIAFNLTTGTMYAISATNLYTLDFMHANGTTVTATAVGTGTGDLRLQGLVVGSDGTIYADNTYVTIGPDKPGHLFTINASGVGAIVGSNGKTTGNNYIGDFGDLAFVGSTLYGTFAVNGFTNTFLGTANTGTGAVSSLHDMGVANVDGLAYYLPTSTLYAITRDGTLYTANTSSGALTNAHTTGLSNVYGMTSVPLPPTMLLLGSGLVGVIGLRRKLKG